MYYHGGSSFTITEKKRGGGDSVAGETDIAVFTVPQVNWNEKAQGNTYTSRKPPLTALTLTRRITSHQSQTSTRVMQVSDAQTHNQFLKCLVYDKI